MTWLGNPEDKLNDKQKARLEKKRADLVQQIEDLKATKPTKWRFPHQERHYNEDMAKLAKEVVKIDFKLGRPVDFNSGGAS